MERQSRNYETATKWAVLAGTVVALEIIGQESLTHGFRRALEHPVGRYIAPIAIGLTVGHLFNAIPETIDPYQHVANYLEKRHHGTT
jgi:hypothetical protein